MVWFEGNRYVITGDMNMRYSDVKVPCLKKNRLSPFVRRTYVNGNKFQSVSTCDLTIACDS